MTNIQKAGILSLITIFLWALLNVTVRYFVIEYNSHPLAIACTNSLFCAFALLLIGKRINPLPILKDINTWLLGFSQIFKNVCMIYAFVYISSTEANLLTNVEIILSVLLTWAVFKRRPSFVDFSAITFILFGCLIILANLPSNVRFLAAFWVLAASIFTSLRSILVERHPQNKKDLSIRSRCAVTGWIMLSTSVVFSLFFIVTA